MNEGWGWGLPPSHPTPEGSRDAGAPLRGAASLRELQSGGGTATWLDSSKKALHDSPPTSSASAPWWEIHEKIIIPVSGGQGAEAGLGTAPGARRVGWAQDTLLPWDWGGPEHIFSWSGFSLGQGGAGKVRGRRSRGHFSRFPTGAPDPNTHTCGILPPPRSRKG